MFNDIKWHDCIPGNWDTYPGEIGQYLIKYKDDTNTSFYMIAYFRPKNDKDLLGNDKTKGFYFDEDCSKEAEIESKWGYKPIAWVFLPNLLQKDGLYR